MSLPRVDRVLRRGVAVATLAGLAQALVLAAGWFFVYESTHENVARSVEDVIVQSNVAAVNAVVDALGGLPDLREAGGPEWERTQSLLERLELGGDGFACILGREGRIVCHPDLRTQPGLRDVNLSAELVTPIGDSKADGLPLGSIAPGRLFTGVVDFPFDGKHYIATQRDPESGSQLIVHQPVSGLTAAGRQVTRGLLLEMLLVGIAVVGLTALVAVKLVGAHGYALVRWNRGLERKVVERAAELTRTHRAIVFGMAKLSEYRDNETGLHVERMCAYSAALARELARRGRDIDETWIENLELAASLHDIGKVSIPDRILLKPGRLTPEEFEVMKQHAAVGEETLAAVRHKVDDASLIELAMEIAGGHHERWDGTGYPRGLAGDAIPLSARIVAVADVFDALLSKRVYKDAMPFGEVKRIVTESSGNHFDPAVVEAFHAVSDELLDIRRRLQDVEEPASLVSGRADRATEVEEEAVGAGREGAA